MELNYDGTFVDLENLLQIAGGDKARVEKYLNQFAALIPERMEKLRDSLDKEDRALIRQVVHNMAPQLQFFGLPDIVSAIQKLELEYQTMPMPELTALSDRILYTTEKALEEIINIIKTNF